MKLKKAFSLLLCASFGILGGCAPGLNSNELMRPPKTTGDEAKIIELIEQTAGNSYTLKYPENGNNRSAIVTADLDGDNKDEAVAFYKNAEDTAITHMLIMYNTEDGWKIAGHTQNQNADVDRIEFADINNDGKMEIIAGYKTFDANINQMTVYLYDKGNAESVKISQTYTSFVINDFNGDTCSNIMLFSILANKKSNANLLTYNKEDNSLVSLSSVPIDPNITGFENIISGKINDEQIGVAVDGTLTADKLSTQIIYYDPASKSLLNPLYNPSGEKINPTLRDLKIHSADIDQNKIVEVPVLSKLPYTQEESLENVASLAVWNQYDSYSGSLAPGLNMIVNYTGGYYFKLDGQRLNHITARTDSAENSMTLYEWNDGTVGQELLKIKNYKANDWATNGKKDGYTLLKQDGTYDYCYKLLSTTSSYVFSDDEIQKAFLAFSDISN